MRAAAGDTQIEWQAATHSEVGSVYDTNHSEILFFFYVSHTCVGKCSSYIEDSQEKPPPPPPPLNLLLGGADIHCIAFFTQSACLHRRTSTYTSVGGEKIQHAPPPPPLQPLSPSPLEKRITCLMPTHSTTIATPPPDPKP